MIAKLCEYSKSSRNIVNRFLETLSKTILNKTKFSRPIDIIRSEFLGRISGHKNITELLQKDPQTLLILNTEINVSYPYIYDRLTKIRKIIIFQPTYASSGWLELLPAAHMGGNQNPWRKSTQTWGKHANTTEWPQPGINFFSSTL